MNHQKKISAKKSTLVKRTALSPGKTSTLKLINGVFNPEEAKDVLLSIYRSKIQFHEMRNFSYKERYGAEDKNSVKRIPLLKKSMERIKKLIQRAESRGELLSINTEVNITFKKTKK
jgi:hypothetical protein